ncbi:MAG: hypothetical protein M0R51_15345, partial [Clostridia bacterium]|nr:hypothetical protein [Clostridia bacterium]
EAVKNALERTARGFEFEYKDIDNNSEIDLTNKKITIKDGLSIDEVINTLIDSVTTVLLTTRRAEGLENLEDFEQNAVIYAVKSKLGLDVPDFTLDTNSLNENGLVELKNNLQKIRSVTKQMLSNIESSIEYAVRQLIKEEKEKTGQVEENKEQIKHTTKPKTEMAKVNTKKTESEVQ